MNDKQLETVRAEGTFDDFFRATAADWRRMARYVLAHLDAPPFVEPADIEQELLEACWKAVRRWDPKRGVPIKRYVVWQAINAAKKYLYRQRRTKGRRKELSASERERYDVLINALVSEPGQEAGLLREQATRESLARCHTQRKQVCAEAFIRAGSVERAAALLYANPKARQECRFSSAKHARRIVQRAAEEAAGA